MKRFILSTLALLLSLSFITAQNVPQGINYQAVARDVNGKVLSDQSITVKISLLTDLKGSVVYDEIHDVETNSYGMFNMTIGQGEPVRGAFENIPWDAHQIWMEIAMDETGGENFKIVNTTKLLAVPYAFHSGTADKIGGGKKPNGESLVPWWGQPWWNIEGLEKTNPDKHFVGNIDSIDLVFRTNNLERLRIKANGEIVMPGDVEIGGTLEVKGDSTIVKNLYVTGEEAVIDSFLYVGEDANFGDNINVVNNITAGGDGTFLNIRALNNGKIDNMFTVDGTSNLNGPLNVGGATTINNTLNVASTSDLNGQVTIHADITDGAAADYSQYPLRVEGGDHGVAIKINDLDNGNSPDRTRNFLTLYNGDEEPMGRIEGFQGLTGIATNVINSIISDLEDLADTVDDGDEDIPPTDVPPSAEQYFNNDYAVGALTETLDLANGITKLATNSIACVAGVGVAGDCDDVFWSAVDAIVQAVQLGGYIAYHELNLGAAFESGGADYAEWLKKANYEENINFGEVVGVKGGLISKKFEEAERFMVVSNNPTIIGAMPDAGSEYAFEKIAFMGQVPVKVIGEVKLGDYILPSGNGDGMAIAVDLEEMKAKDYSRIIGIAWSTSDGKELYKYINVAVGLNTNDMAGMIEDMQLVMNEMQQAIAKLSPDYSPVYFDVEGNVKQREVRYTTSPSMNEVLAQQIGISQNASREEAFQAIRDYAVAMNVDLGQYPYLSDMLENPNDLELMIKARDHYSRASLRLSSILSKVQQQGK